VDKEIRPWNTGQTWSLFKRDSAPISERYGVPMFMLHRGDLHAALVEGVKRLDPDAIHLDHLCVGFEQHGNQVELKFANGESAKGGVLIGADGLHSQIRAQLFGAAKPRFTGQVAWRGLAPMHTLPEHQRRGGHELDRAESPYDVLPGKKGRARQRGRAGGPRRLARRIVDDGRHARGVPRVFSGLAQRSADDAQEHHDALQVGPLPA